MKKIIAVILCISLILSSSVSVFAAKKDYKGSTLRLAKTEGTVSIKDSSGNKVSLIKNMKLYSGYQVSTSAKSYAYISLDDSKALKLDASSSVEVRKSGKKLEVLLQKGLIFFNVDEKLASDETMTIRSNTMVTGITGTAGQVGESELVLVSGSVSVSTADGQEVQLQSGHILKVTEEKSEETSGAEVAPVEEKISIAPIQELTELSGFSLEYIKETPALQERLEEDNSFSAEQIKAAVEAADEILASDEQKAELEAEKATEELLQAEKDSIESGQSQYFMFDKNGEITANTSEIKTTFEREMFASADPIAKTGDTGRSEGRNNDPPVDPPVDPTPVDPTPVDPTPVDPTPVDPTPVDPTPTDDEVDFEFVANINIDGLSYEAEAESGAACYALKANADGKNWQYVDGSEGKFVYSGKVASGAALTTTPPALTIELKNYFDVVDSNHQSVFVDVVDLDDKSVLFDDSYQIQFTNSSLAYNAYSVEKIIDFNSKKENPAFDLTYGETLNDKYKATQDFKLIKKALNYYAVSTGEFLIANDEYKKVTVTVPDWEDQSGKMHNSLYTTSSLFSVGVNISGLNDSCLYEINGSSIRPDKGSFSFQSTFDQYGVCQVIGENKGQFSGTSYTLEGKHGSADGPLDISNSDIFKNCTQITIKSGAAVYISGSLKLTNSTNLIIEEGGTLSISGNNSNAEIDYGCTVENHGTLLVSVNSLENKGTIKNHGTLSVHANTNFNNNLIATIENSNNGTIEFECGAFHNNYGFVIDSGSSNLTITCETFNNNGLIIKNGSGQISITYNNGNPGIVIRHGSSGTITINGVEHK